MVLKLNLNCNAEEVTSDVKKSRGKYINGQRSIFSEFRQTEKKGEHPVRHGFHEKLFQLKVILNKLIECKQKKEINIT